MRGRSYNHKGLGGGRGSLQTFLSVLVFLALLLNGVCASETAIPLPPAPLRPDAEAGPTKVSVGVWVCDITRIDSVAQTFSASVVLVMRWKDSRLAHAGPGVKTYDPATIWYPQWLIGNEAGASDRSLPEIVDVTPEGMVIYRQRLVGSFSQGLNLRRFPFDSDTFRFHLVFVGYRPEEIQFVPDETLVAAGMASGAGIAKNLTLKDWRILSSTTGSRPYLSIPGIEVAGYAFEFKAARNAWHFILKVIVPLILIVIMSWAVFWIEPNDTGSQVGVSVTAMLTLIAYRFAVDFDVPKLPYITRLDAFILASTVLVFLSLIEVVVTTKLANLERTSAARKIDRYSRWAFPLVFTVLTALIFLR